MFKIDHVDERSTTCKNFRGGKFNLEVIMQKGTQWILNSPEFRTALRGGDETAVKALKDAANGMLTDFTMAFGLTNKPDPEMAESLYDLIYDAVREPETAKKDTALLSGGKERTAA